MRTMSVCLWRVLNAYVEEAHQSVDLFDLTQSALMNSVIERGINTSPSLPIWSKSVVYAVKGKDKSTWERFCEDPQRRNGHPHAITYVTDMGLAYQSGVRENCRDAEIVFDKFHVMKLIGERVDDVRKAESAHGKTEAKKQLKKTLCSGERIQRIYPNLNRLVLTALTTTICGRQRHIKCVWHSKKSTIPSRIRVGQSADSRAGAISNRVCDKAPY